MLPRSVLLLAAVGVGALFIAGLFVHGVTGGVLLLATVAVLVALSLRARAAIAQRDRVLRGLVVLAIAALAVAKLTGHG